ncbi:MAG: putative DNA binding domain-containing protein, partial [Eggerthellaceae bacterium]|nr:putative DNA binding domain-containing protein [Eggerthellaceae bacterium]
MASLSAFTNLKEDGRLEAKDARGGFPRSVWATYSAFANTQGGTILLGVIESASHDLIPVGLPDPAETVKKFWDGVNNPKVVSANILIDSDVSIERIDGTDIVAINVPRAPRAIRPIYLNERVLTETYRRNGEGDYHCSEDEIKSMLRDQAAGLPDKMPVESVGIDALDPASIEAFRNEAAMKRPGHPWNRLSADEFLVRLGATIRSRNDGLIHPTRAGLLMFGREYEITNEFPFYFIEYREVLSSKRWDFRIVTNDGEWSGGIYDYWSRAYPRLTADLARPFELNADMSRIEETPLHIALREALANTLIHADYQGRSGTTIIRYDDRATFTNAGSLLIPAEVAMGGGVSEVRNPTIMKMFNFIGIGEKAGSGFDAMRQGCDWAGLEHPILAETFEP